jgi:ribosomal protein S18 acetylase RimI-like enzyme
MIELQPMSKEAFKKYYDASVVEYAREMAAAGNVSQEEARAASEKQFADLLPDGLESPGQHIFTIWDQQNERSVGMVWLGERAHGQTSQAVIYDIRVDEGLRGQGYGSAALQAVEEVVQDLDLPEIWLHVFGHNTGARRLYDRLGYEVTNVTMRKKLQT